MQSLGAGVIAVQLASGFSKAHQWLRITMQKRESPQVSHKEQK